MKDDGAHKVVARLVTSTKDWANILGISQKELIRLGKIGRVVLGTGGLLKLSNNLLTSFKGVAGAIGHMADELLRAKRIGLANIGMINPRGMTNAQWGSITSQRRMIDMYRSGSDQAYHMQKQSNIARYALPRVGPKLIAQYSQSTIARDAEIESYYKSTVGNQPKLLPGINMHKHLKRNEEGMAERNMRAYNKLEEVKARFPGAARSYTLDRSMRRTNVAMRRISRPLETAFKVSASTIRASSTKISHAFDKVSVRASAMHLKAFGTSDKLNTPQNFKYMAAPAVMGGIYGFGRMLTQAIKTMGALDDYIKNIEALTGGAEGRSYMDMGKMHASIIRSAASMPTTASELASLVASALKLGVKFSDKEGISKEARTVGFAKSAIELGVATDLNPSIALSQVAKTLTIIKGIGGVSKTTGEEIRFTEEMLAKFSSAVAWAGNNTAATSKDILEATKRFAVMSSALGVSADEAVGVTSALLNIGLTARIAGRGMNDAVRVMASQREQIAGYIGAIKGGEAATEFKLALDNKEALKALFAFAATMKDSSKNASEHIKTMGEFGLYGDTAIKVFNSLGMSLEVFNKIMDGTTKAYNEGTYATKLYLIRASSVSNQLLILVGGLDSVAETFGQTLRPVVVATIQTMGYFIDLFLSLPNAVKWVITSFSMLTAALTLYAIAVKVGLTTVFIMALKALGTSLIMVGGLFKHVATGGWLIISNFTSIILRVKLLTKAMWGLAAANKSVLFGFAVLAGLTVGTFFLDDIVDTIAWAAGTIAAYIEKMYAAITGSKVKLFEFSAEEERAHLNRGRIQKMKEKYPWMTDEQVNAQVGKNLDMADRAISDHNSDYSDWKVDNPGKRKADFEVQMRKKDKDAAEADLLKAIEDAKTKKISEETPESSTIINLNMNGEMIAQLMDEGSLGKPMSMA